MKPTPVSELVPSSSAKSSFSTPKRSMTYTPQRTTSSMMQPQTASPAAETKSPFSFSRSNNTSAMSTPLKSRQSSMQEHTFIVLDEVRAKFSLILTSSSLMTLLWCEADWCSCEQEIGSICNSGNCFYVVISYISSFVLVRMLSFHSFAIGLTIEIEWRLKRPRWKFLVVSSVPQIGVRTSMIDFVEVIDWDDKSKWWQHELIDFRFLLNFFITCLLVTWMSITRLQL